MHLCTVRYMSAVAPIPYKYHAISGVQRVATLCPRTFRADGGRGGRDGPGADADHALDGGAGAAKDGGTSMRGMAFDSGVM